MVKKIIIALVVIIFLGLGFLLFSQRYSYQETLTTIVTPTPTPEVTDVGPFSVVLPYGWRYEPQLGVDSQVGTFIGDGVTLLFDYGYYSNELAREGDVKYDVTYEVIDGRSAKMVLSKIPDKGLIGVYFEDVKATPSGIMNTKLNINGENIPTGLVERVLSIVRSVRFND